MLSFLKIPKCLFDLNDMQLEVPIFILNFQTFSSHDSYFDRIERLGILKWNFYN